MLLNYAFQDNTDGVYIQSRLDGALFNLSRLKSKRNTSVWKCTDLLFADDAALVSHEEHTLQRLLDKLSGACEVFKLKISVGKTEVMAQGVNNPPSITLHNEVLVKTEKFKYLGSVFTSNVSLDDELNIRIGRAASSFGKLIDKVWQNHKLTIKTKVRVYETCVIPVLLYGSECWTLYSYQERKLNSFHMRCLRKIMGISRQDKVSNNKVLQLSEISSIHDLTRRNRLRWLGHLSRMSDDRMPKNILYGELREGGRSRGRPKLRYKDVCKSTLAELSIDTAAWEALASMRPEWRTAVNSGAARYEERRRERHDAKRRQQKDRVAAGVTDGPALRCAYCNRECRARIGLISHERKCATIHANRQ